MELSQKNEQEKNEGGKRNGEVKKVLHRTKKLSEFQFCPFLFQP